MAVVQLLTGHTSAETAHVTEDYPYGFVLRCVRKEWLEYRKEHGYRFVTMTTNPKRVGTHWNKPKASRYVDLAVLYLDESEHIQWSTLHMHATETEIDRFAGEYGEALAGELEQKILTILRAVARATVARRAEYSYSIRGSEHTRMA